ncbi:SDR family NAD(P)-dependent oxidoreductase [Nocardia wallacei]|uniref:SDR family NAD(P)-dependent oxidoreductase n=1 Tax=Nocardia wallacei TaxID=480035 RepID=UPI00245529B8|nr:SDR family NAD(P)-dependent oxidoreductase [Nocardia wallacei]
MSGVLFLFSGPGGEHGRMGRALAARYPVFARTVDAATEAVVRAGGRRVWTPRHGFAKSLETADAVQPALYVYQLALAELVRAWGIRADAVVGHGAGEVAAAVVSGALTPADGARVVTTRGHTLARLADPGAAAVVEAAAEDVRRLVEPMRSAISIATVNGPRSVVVTGVPRYVETLVRRARRRGLPARLSTVDPLTHVRTDQDALPEFASRLDGVLARTPRVPFYSTVRRGRVSTDADLTAEYWAENASGAVELDAALAAAAANGLSTVVEIAPDPTLTSAVRDNPAFADSTYPLVVGDNEAESFLEAVARLYAGGRLTAPARISTDIPPADSQTTEPHIRSADTRADDGRTDIRSADSRATDSRDDDARTAGASSASGSDGIRPVDARSSLTGPAAGESAEMPRHSADTSEALRGAAVYDPTVATATEWAASILNEECWVPVERLGRGVPADPPFYQGLVVGESAAAAGLEEHLSRRIPALRITRDPVDAGPIVASMLADHAVPTAVALVWSTPELPGPVTTGVAGALDVLQRLQDSAAVATLTVVLTDRASLTQHAIAGLVRSLQLESRIPTRLIWTSDDDPAPVADLVLEPAGPQEVRIFEHTVTARRFRTAPGAPAPIGVRPEGTYVVTGGLGALGSVAARWLLDAGARDLVVLTRTPRPLPQLLEGLDDRIVVVRCDVTDRADLANALFDIRACGSTIRGAVHAAGVRRDAEFATVTPALLAELFEPRAGAARHLIDLTAADPIDFVLLSSSATGALGAPGQAADAAAHAALDALARNRVDDRVRSIGWGHWISGPVTPTTDARWRRAGVTPFDVARGTAVLSVALAHRTPTLLALDYTPTGDTSPMATRLRDAIPQRPAHVRPRSVPDDLTTLPGRPPVASLSAALAENIRPARHRDSP